MRHSAILRDFPTHKGDIEIKTTGATHGPEKTGCVNLEVSVDV